jgi:hypothetical protein
METSKPNGRNSIAKLGYGQICLKEQNLKSNKKIDLNPLKKYTKHQYDFKFT